MRLTHKGTSNSAKVLRGGLRTTSEKNWWWYKDCVGVLRQDPSWSSTCKFSVVKADKSKPKKHQMQTFVLSLKEQSFWNSEDNTVLQMVKPHNALHVITLLQTVKFKCRQVKSQDRILSVRSGLISYVKKNIFIKIKSSNSCQFTWFWRILKSHSAWTALWILFMSQAALGWLC